MIAPLPERLRLETRTLHTEAERSPFMATLLRGRMDRGAYAMLLRNLLAIYAVLEPALRRHAAHPAMAPFDLASLVRTPSLLADLRVLESTSAAAPSMPIEAAASAYVERLHELDATRPELLLAHAYVRYLGDLSGGQLLGPIVAASMKLPPGAGTAFYDFGDRAMTAARTRAFRAALEQAVVADSGEIVAEAKQAFERHRELFDELARRVGLAA